MPGTPENFTYFDQSLDIYTTKLRLAISESRLEDAFELIAKNIIYAWYGIPNNEFIKICQLLVDSGEDKSGILKSLVYWVQNPDSQARFEKIPLQGNYKPNYSIFYPLLHMIRHRVSGKIHLAVAESLVAETSLQDINPMYNNDSVVSIYSTIQIGQTALMAGDMRRALSLFTSATMYQMVPMMSFLTREAYLLQALIHAAFGDKYAALHLMKKSEELERTSSWYEEQLDATRAIVESLIENDQKIAKAILEAIPSHLIAENWSAYLFALFKALIKQQKVDEIFASLATFENVRFARVIGEGMPGSIVYLLQALLNLKIGNFTNAIKYSKKVDQTIPIIRLITAAIDLHLGKTELAKTVCESLKHETLGLRRFELWRVSVLATAYIELGQNDSAEELLSHTLISFGPLEPLETGLFPDLVQNFAAKIGIEWVEPAPAVLSLFSSSRTIVAPLTEREEEILTLLQQNFTRDEIAKKLFVSKSTVKTHTHNLYKKLGVSNRTSAILAAQKIGLL